MNDSHKFVPLQFYEQSPVSLECFDIRKDDSDYLTKKYMSQRVGFDFSDIKIRAERCHYKVAAEVFFKLQQSYNIILLAETKFQNQTVY